MRCRSVLPTVLTLLLPAAAARAAEFHVDPAAGAPGNDGSQASPWSTLEQVTADGKIGTTVKAGDTIWLHSGYHGEVVLRSGTYVPPITVAAVAGANARVRRLSFTGTHGWLVSGLDISLSHAASYTNATMVAVDGSSTDIEVRGCVIQSVADAAPWSADQWIKTAANGIDVSGDRITVRNNLVRNVRFGISVSGDNVLVDGNQVVNFSADGLRGLGNYGTFQYNTIKNVYVDDGDGDTNHDDGFQSWSVGTGGVGTGEVVGVTLRGNLFINNEDPNQPWKASMQGIGCFDGYFRDWVIENNVVMADHWHGLSMYGMRGGRVVNNTVVDINTASPGPSWIKVTAHKNGTPSENVLVRNNLATDFDVEGTKVINDHNLEITMTAVDSHFVNHAGFDLHLLSSSPAVNAGLADQAPALDRDGITRPQGAAVDIGAYEWHAPDVRPVDGGAPSLPDAGTAIASADGRNGVDADVNPGTSGGCTCRMDGTARFHGLSLVLCGLVALLCLRRIVGWR